MKKARVLSKIRLFGHEFEPNSVIEVDESHPTVYQLVESKRLSFHPVQVVHAMTELKSPCVKVELPASELSEEAISELLNAAPATTLQARGDTDVANKASAEETAESDDSGDQVSSDVSADSPAGDDPVSENLFDAAAATPVQAESTTGGDVATPDDQTPPVAASAPAKRGASRAKKST